MPRFRLLLLNEFKLARTAIPIHMIPIIQPSLMFLLMALILVHPTFDMNVVQPVTDEGYALIEAMQQVGSPIGEPYINPVIVNSAEPKNLRQVISVENRAGLPTAVQRFGLIDSNQVKNLRNRLTAATLRMWQTELGDRAVTVEEYPWLPADLPYTLYFGMAMLPLTVFLAASLIGGILTAQDFEFFTILEYRLAPVSPVWVLGARLTRLVLSSLLAGGMLLLTLGLYTGIWPRSLWQTGLILLPVAIIAASLGVILGLLFRRSIPAFVSGLIFSLAGWLFGSAFGPAASFGGMYEQVSYLTPNAYAVELLFPCFYGIQMGQPALAALVLTLLSAGMLMLVSLTYHWRLTKQG